MPTHNLHYLPNATTGTLSPSVMTTLMPAISGFGPRHCSQDKCLSALQLTQDLALLLDGQASARKRLTIKSVRVLVPRLSKVMGSACVYMQSGLSLNLL
jgi:hypothetical protein